jgi:hypothetical protein
MKLTVTQLPKKFLPILMKAEGSISRKKRQPLVPVESQTNPFCGLFLLKDLL